MDNEKRALLELETWVKLNRDNQPIELQITGLVGKGGSCVCYDAVGRNGKRYRLKEFAPVSAGQSSKTEFQALHLRIQDLMQTKMDLKTFIPNYDVLYDCEGTKEQFRSIYLLFDAQPIISLCDYAQKIREKKQDELFLYVILTAFRTIAECTALMHENDILHLDLKPQNIGFSQLQNGKIRTEQISFFDIDSFYSYDDPGPQANLRGTCGFCAPELFQGHPTAASDIYAIGASLFDILLNPIEQIGSGYNQMQYSRIGQLVKQSPLFRSTDVTDNIYLRDAITKILEQCLSPSPCCRFQSCKVLGEKLDEASRYLIPSAYSEKIQKNHSLSLSQIGSKMDKTGSRAKLLLQRHLYVHPLYEQLKMDSKELRVLVLGSGNHAQRFLDACLPLGVDLDLKFRVDVASATVERDKELFLSNNDRPALQNFFAIDREAEDEYGAIFFRECTFSSRNTDSIKNLVAQTNPDYVFIALGSDKVSAGVAKFLLSLPHLPDPDLVSGGKENNKSLRYIGEKHSSVYYIAEQEPTVLPEHAVRLDLNLDKDPAIQELERQGLNLHLLWNNKPNATLSQIKKDYLKDYNRFSSLSSAISIPYKFFLLGIPYAHKNPATSVDLYVERLSKEGNRNLLIVKEQHRWTIDKVCDGYSPRTDFDQCVADYIASGIIVNKKDLKHVCIVRSGINDTLSTWPRAKWNTATDEDLKELDPLEQMSVRLHKAFFRYVEQAKQKENILSGSEVREINVQIKNYSKCCTAFQDLLLLMQRIWVMLDPTAAKQFGYTKDKFLKIARTELPLLYYTSVKNNVSSLSTRFAPFLRCAAYLNYRDNDALIVDGLPFVLTYSNTLHVAVPMDLNSLDKNIQAAGIISPKSVSFLFHLDNMEQVKALCKMMEQIREMRSTYGFTARYELLVGYDKKKLDKEKLDAQIGQTINTYRLLPCADKDIFVSQLQKILAKRTSRINAVQRNDTELSGCLLKPLGLPHYKYDPESGCFGGNWLVTAHLRMSRFMTLSEKLGIEKLSGNRETSYALYNDFEALFAIYRSNPSAWKSACKDLRDKQSLVRFNRPVGVFATETYRYLLPAFTFTAVEKIAAVLSEEQVVEEYTLRFYTPDTIELCVTGGAFQKTALNMVFQDPYQLAFGEDVVIIPSEKVILVDIHPLTIRITDSLSSETANVLNQCEKTRQIRCIRDRNNSISGFYCSSHAVRDLLTKEGTMLEFYVYHKLLQSGLFDDISMSYHVYWGDTAADSEFDIVAMKQSQLYLIECKARKYIDQDVIWKLTGQANKLNAHGILIVDGFDSDNSGNQVQLERSNVNELLLISEPDDILNIDQTLEAFLLNNE